MTHDDHALTEPTREVPLEAIELFVRKHRCHPIQQVLALVEEVGEFSEAVNTESKEFSVEVAEELADIIFIALSLAIIYDVDVVSELHEVTQENLRKNADTQGNKVTKE